MTKIETITISKGNLLEICRDAFVDGYASADGYAAAPWETSETNTDTLRFFDAATKFERGSSPTLPAFKFQKTFCSSCGREFGPGNHGFSHCEGPRLIERSAAMTVKPVFAWYDLWIGAFYDRAKRRLYVFPVPCIGFYLEWSNVS